MDEVTDPTDVTANVVLPADPDVSVRSVVIPATPVTPEVDVTDIPTVTLPWTKATKSHVAAAITAVVGVGQVALQFLPHSDITEYIAAGVGVVSVIAVWMGVYITPNLPKFNQKK